MADATIRIQGLDRVLSLLSQLPKRVQVALLREMEEGAREINNLAKKEAPRDERRLANSISFKPIKDGYTVVAQSDYAAFLEFGTKGNTRVPVGLEQIAAQFKGQRGPAGDPLKALEAWVKRKGIAGRFSVRTRRRLGSKATKEQQDKQAAFIIWQKIKKKGIKAQPYFFKQVKVVEPKIKKRVADIISQII